MKKTKNEKLTLEAFKNRTKKNGSELSMSKIAGGILGACHDVYCDYHKTGYDCFYYK